MRGRAGLSSSSRDLRYEAPAPTGIAITDESIQFLPSTSRFTSESLHANAFLRPEVTASAYQRRILRPCHSLGPSGASAAFPTFPPLFRID